jgi:uncharacterized protein involved in exopolysaccharide biosynthesis
MSVEFRQRTPGEYAKIASKHKWLIILPAIAIATAVSWVVIQLPDLYESSTLIVVKPSTLPNSVVPTITEDSLTRQINSIALPSARRVAAPIRGNVSGDSSIDTDSKTDSGV